MIIKACYGLSRYLEGMVQGGNVWKNIIKDKIGKQKLTGKQILELAKICLSIEKHYKSPQDIEWAYSAGKFYITQFRPITTL